MTDGDGSTVGEQQRFTPDSRLTLNLSAEEREAVFDALTRGCDDMEMHGDEEDRRKAELVRDVYPKIAQGGNDAE